MSTSMKKMQEIFYTVLDKKITLDNALKSIEKKKKSKIAKGYIQGIKSITGKKRKKYSLNPRKLERNEIKHLQKMIRKNLRNPFLPGFEKGYFIAWKDYLNYLKRSYEKLSH